MGDEQDSDPHGDWLDSQDLPVSKVADYLLSELDWAESPEEHRRICARLIRGSQHLDADQISALAQAVEAGFPKRRRGHPIRAKRAREIRDLLIFGGFLLGRSPWERSDVIRELMHRYGMVFKTAEAEYDKANKALKAEFKLRNVRNLG